MDLLKLCRKILTAKHVGVLTGAGVSKPSGIPTFRGKDGLYKGRFPEELATPYGFYSNPKLVWEWYNWRRKIIIKAKPNVIHKVLARMEREIEDFWVITQNVDGLHRIAGSKNLIELHGNIFYTRCTVCGKEFEDYKIYDSSELPPFCPECKGLLRPAVVWFGERLDSKAIQKAFRLAEIAEIFMVIGTSGLVYPAAELPYIAKERGAIIVEINPNDTPISLIADIVIREKAEKVFKEWEYACLSSNS